MKTYQLALAGTILMASCSVVAAEEWRMDPTPDHIYYYGPVAHQSAPTAGHRASKPVAYRQPRAAEVPIDRTADHVLYYGPVAR